MLRKSLLLSAALLLTPTDSLACRQSAGVTASDKSVAASLCSGFSSVAAVQRVTVQEQLILRLDISFDLYRGWRADEPVGEKSLRDLHWLFLNKTGRRSGTVMIYVDGDKVADATSTLTGNVRVRLTL